MSSWSSAIIFAISIIQLFEIKLGICHPRKKERRLPTKERKKEIDIYTCTLNRFDPGTGRTPRRIFSFLTQNRPKVDFDPYICKYCSDQSIMLNFMKILKSCFQVIQRTWRSGKLWLRYSAFSTISRVKWKHDTIFEQCQPTNIVNSSYPLAGWPYTSLGRLQSGTNAWVLRD